ncbi:MAG: HAMP domain-containing protein [Candidatus Omnitrophica bacterium]|nr:HAMP domain-containing protein [Candidatus Omnitrophota bacterium]
MRISEKLLVAFAFVFLLMIAVFSLAFWSVSRLEAQQDKIRREFVVATQIMHIDRLVNKQLRELQALLTRGEPGLRQFKKYKTKILFLFEDGEYLIRQNPDSAGEYAAAFDLLKQSYSRIQGNGERAFALYAGDEKDSAFSLVDDIHTREFDGVFTRVVEGLIGKNWRRINQVQQEGRELEVFLNRLSLIIMSLGVIFLVLLLAIINRVIVTPLAQLREATVNLGRGDLSYRVSVASNDEIGLLAASFNTMTEQLQESTTSIENLNKEITERKLAEEELRRAYQKLKETEAQLIQSEKMAALGLLVSGLAHELNNPSGYMMSNLQTLNEYQQKLCSALDALAAMVENADCVGGEATNALRERLGQIERERGLDYIKKDLPSLIRETLNGAERIKKIVSDVSTFGDPEWAERQPTNINEEIDRALTLVWNELKYTCEVIKEYSELPLTEASPGQLDRVFVNILLNAGQAIEEKGTIVIKTYTDASAICVEITDTGRGITESEIGKIFDPFYSTRGVGKGVGLGLSAAYGIVKQHGGTIDVKSAPGKGTTFTIRLPIKARHAYS